MWYNGLVYLLCVPLCGLFGVPLVIGTYDIVPGGMAARKDALCICSAVGPCLFHSQPMADGIAGGVGTSGD